MSVRLTSVPPWSSGYAFNGTAASAGALTSLKPAAPNLLTNIADRVANPRVDVNEPFSHEWADVDQGTRQTR